MKIGRPPFKITAAVKRKACRLASEGISKKAIAATLGMGYSTLMKKQQEDSSLVQAMEQGRQILLGRLCKTTRSELFEAAINGDFESMRRFLVQRNPECWSYGDDHARYKAQKRQRQAEQGIKVRMADSPVLVLEPDRRRVSLFVVLLPGGPVLVSCSGLCQPGNLRGWPLV